MGRIVECLHAFLLEVASLLLYIKTLHISVTHLCCAAVVWVNVTGENIGSEGGCRTLKAESAVNRFFTQLLMKTQLS